MIPQRLLPLPLLSLLLFLLLCPGSVPGQDDLVTNTDSLTGPLPTSLRSQLERVRRGTQALATHLPLVEHLYRRDPPLAYELIRQIRQLEAYQVNTEQWAQ